MSTHVAAMLLLATIWSTRPFHQPAPGCGSAADSTAASSALGCLTLVPVPSHPEVSGSIELLPADTPFGVAVTADGRPRHRLRATIAGLPEPSRLGAYTTFIAWAYTLALDSAVKLGPVHNGTMELGELTHAQFRILVSAERSASVRERSGPLILRGTSPSARLAAHRDMVSASAPGVVRDPSPPPNDMSAMHGGVAAHGEWAMPPMPAWLAPMPGMAALRPSVQPFVPAAGYTPAQMATVLPAQPRRLVRLRSGDTLELDARLVRRTIGGRTYVMYGFNGQYPGPLIDVPQGATIVVRFTNRLDQPTAVHWHGVRLDNRFDGAVGVTQDAVPPRAPAFIYTVHFPDAGIYWYHPHVREDIQQDLGLYGNMLVRSPRADYYARADREEVLMLDDLLVDDDGSRSIVPHGAESPTHALMGRFGNVMLVNGEPSYRAQVRRGEVVRFFLTNVSNARIYNLSFPGARMKVVGGDVGKLEREAWVESVVIAPAERWVVDVAFPRSGSVPLVNRIQALDHMIGRYLSQADTLGIVRVAPGQPAGRAARAFSLLRRNDDVAADIAPFRQWFDKAPDKTLFATMRSANLPAAVASMLIGINAPVEWNDGMPMMNWVVTGKEVSWVLRDLATGRENMDIGWQFPVGSVVKLRLVNDPSSSHAMDHPIHLHGQRFLVLDRDGVRSTNLVWKDTAVIAAGETVDLLVDMSNPGKWMVHCHIAEHLGAGMMAVFSVE